MQPGNPIQQDLVLIGGGHSHAIALKKLAMSPIPGVRLTLISNVVQTPYSGMLPGYVAGLYSFDQCHIDLHPLAQMVGAQFILDEAIALDLETNQVICAHHPPIRFDRLSIDIGSTPATAVVPGADENAIAVKPIAKFLQQWDKIVETVQQHPDRSQRLVIVGGGAGGVELALSVQARLQAIYRQANYPTRQLTVHLVHRGRNVVPERSAWVQNRLKQVLQQQGIQLHLGESVSQIYPDFVECESGLKIDCDRAFWVTQASAAPWIRQSGLATDERGFLQVNDFLQSVSHPQIFAAGDIATMVHHPRPKAGVFAVRQGTPLVTNLRRSLLKQPLKPFHPQPEFLILIGTGDRRAIASRGSLGFGPYGLLWRWKDHIDRKFMDQFCDLTPMQSDRRQPTNSPPLLKKGLASDASFSTAMRCSGCGAKVGSAVLETVVQRIHAEQQSRPLANSAQKPRNDILVGLDAPDDAAVVRVPPGQALVQTVDYFPALINDPFLLGQITTQHCLNDLFAMGATPQSALAIATLLPGNPTTIQETLYHLLSGAIAALNPVGATLIGGHTIEGTELSFGLTCNGLAPPDVLLYKTGMQPGQVLILTKGLGTGILCAAHQQLKAKGTWMQAAIASMVQSNSAAIAIGQRYGIMACTDISGFGLAGHLLEMITASQVSVELDLSAIHRLDGVDELIYQHIASSLYPQNYQASQAIANREQISHLPGFPVLFDPQTSGGLLMAIPEHHALDCLTDLQSEGYSHSRIIGRVTTSNSTRHSITIFASSTDQL